LQWSSWHLPKGFQNKLLEAKASKGDMSNYYTPQLSQKPDVQQHPKLKGAHWNNQVIKNKI
jgi:hypothetical protein